MRLPVLELVIPAAVRPEAVLRALGTEVDLLAGEATLEDRVLLDSVDGRLRAEGLRFEQAVPRKGAPARLTLREAGVPDEAIELSLPRADRLLPSDLPGCRMRDRLEGVLQERAALPLARVASTVLSLSVLNPDQKTVARIRVEESELVAGTGEPLLLDTRVIVAGVRGYGKAFERVRAVLESRIGLRAPAATLVEEAVAAAGRPFVAAGRPKVPMAPDDRTDDVALAVCRALADTVEANLPGTLADLDPEFLHDLRVAVRRSRSVLRELKGAFPPEPLTSARADLKWIQAVTGPARDLDVHLLEWPQMVAGLPRASASDLAPLLALLVARREQALAQMREDIASPRFLVAWADWRALLDRPLATEPDDDRPDAARPISKVAGKRIRTVYERMLEDGRAIGADSPAAALHDLRKRGKELRYLLELFGDAFDGGAAAKPVIASLKGLQDVLGRYQDRHVQAEFLRGLGPTLAKGAGGPDALIALGLVIERLAADQDAARAEFGERFAAFASKPTRTIVKRFR